MSTDSAHPNATLSDPSASSRLSWRRRAQAPALALVTLLYAALGFVFGGPLLGMRDWADSSLGRAVWVDLRIVVILGPLLSSFGMLALMPLYWRERNARTLGAWGMTVMGFVLGLAGAEVSYQRDIRAFGAEVRAYVAGGGREPYRREQWWPRGPGCGFVFLYPSHYATTD